MGIQVGGRHRGIPACSDIDSSGFGEFRLRVTCNKLHFGTSTNASIVGAADLGCTVTLTYCITVRSSHEPYSCRCKRSTSNTPIHQKNPSNIKFGSDTSDCRKKGRRRQHPLTGLTQKFPRPSCDNLHQTSDRPFQSSDWKVAGLRIHGQGH
jgi:hypothetical protein